MMRLLGLLMLVAATADAAPRQCQGVQSQLTQCLADKTTCENQLAACKATPPPAPGPTVAPPVTAVTNSGVMASVTVPVSQTGLVDWKVIGPRPPTTYSTGNWTINVAPTGYAVTFTPDAAGTAELRVVVSTGTGVFEYPVVVTVQP